MSYRGIKRVLGETNLERKCRLLFGLCLLFLITGAFWWVSMVTEGLAKDTARTTGRRLVDSYMLKYHWVEVWETRPELKGLVEKMSEDLQLQSYEPKFLALTQTPSPDVFLPESQEEQQILLELRAALKQQQAEEAAVAARERQDAEAQLEAEIDPAQPPEDELAAPKDIVPVFAERRLAASAPGVGEQKSGKYIYYQPVYWKSSCSTVGCHQSKTQVGALPAAEAGTEIDDPRPLRVVKVVMPDDQMQAAVNWTRAILIAAGIITVFMSMIALYIIVRYVIVKPLQHLRDVTDEIAHGNLEVRSDIHTNDEFEELGASFNRMLRHMVDAQDELRKVNLDLDGKVDELARMNVELYEMNRLKSDFLARMSHELRTPLNSIIGFSEVLQGIDALNDKQQRYVRNIQQSGRLLLDLINDILDLAKLESGKMEVRPSEFAIHSVVSSQCDMVRSLTEEKNIDLDYEVDENLPPLFQDQGKTQQILTNLLSNAIKFTPEGGQISVGATRSDDWLGLTVADTGIGIPESDREIIFEKFRQSGHNSDGDTLKREFSGTGLGLSIVKELCILLGGEVIFESELGKGSTFMVRLPWNFAHHARPAGVEEEVLVTS